MIKNVKRGSQKKFKRVEKLLFGIFALFGLIFILVGIFFTVRNFKDNPNKCYTDATIVDLYEGEDNSYTRVKYEVDGKVYEDKINYYSDTYKIGKTITVYYYLDDVSNVYSKASDYFESIFPSAFGLVFFLIGAIGLIVKIKRTKLNEYLKDNGNSINAEFVCVKLNKSYSVNGVNPYRIECKYFNWMDNITYSFLSENIWEDPTQIINDFNIRFFKVYIKDENYKKYYLDIDEVFNKIEKR